MALLVPNVGEVVLLSNLLAGGSLENWRLKLYRNDVTPAEGDTAATFTEANFTGYSDKTLTRSVSGSTWSTPSTSAGVTSSSYAAQTYTSSGTAQTIYGWYIVGATSGTLICSERFDTSRTLVSPDTLTVTPRVELA